MDNIKSNNYLFGGNAVFIEELYNQYMKDSSSVDESWKAYFSSLGDSAESVMKAMNAASWKPNQNRIIGYIDKSTQKIPAQKTDTNLDSELLSRSLKAISLIDAYRIYGHIGISYDPLNLIPITESAPLNPSTYGLSSQDLEKDVFLGGELGIEKAKLGEVYGYLQGIYSNRIGVEFMHIEAREEREWFRTKMEEIGASFSLTNEEKRTTLFSLLEIEMFESFVHVKFPGTKRFSIEGNEASICSLEKIINESVKFGVQEVIIGMAHRGRLNTLTKIMGKPYHAMMSEFKGEMAFPISLKIPGDVKYHLGASSDLEIEGKKVHLSLTPNPSHLEVVNSVVLGKVRAKQDERGDESRSQVMGILLHGDAAFAGQGSVMESICLSQLEGYHTGGTIHIIVNNQIGFTTSPQEARSSRYCSDVMKIINAPIIHVNADDLEGVIFATKLAAEYRARFKKDIALDIVGYRKYGHNEGDEPLFTQPKMYKAIASHKNPVQLYAEYLIQAGIVTQEEYDSSQQNFKKKLNEEYDISQSYKPTKADWLEGRWGEFKSPSIDREEPITGVELSRLKEIGKAISNIPDDFHANPKIERLLQARAAMIKDGKNLDWAAGEALAFGSLLMEGFNIRFTGQDARRGTFSHRHAVLVDQDNERKYTQLNNISANQPGLLEIHNSSLSEFAVMGFEYGYAFTAPKTLTIWEAQFGDFANGAQIIIDQYLASGEAKWLRMNGLVLLLPHGYEGQGPEHSSARLERFLQLCASDNMQVVNCTTPASIYHALRRQMHREFRKPLVVMTPKSLLRHKLAVSNLEDMSGTTKFKPILPETSKDLVSPDKIRKLVLCSGKIYYDLSEKREELGKKDIVLVRLEQFYPFPEKELSLILQQYSKAEVMWCQEEHENMGAFHFLSHRINKVLKSLGHQSQYIKYAGRPASASPAAGYMRIHVQEHAQLLNDVFSG